MIKLENTEVFNFEGAIRGMRNPLNSWDKSDSAYFWSNGVEVGDFRIGENDLALMHKLAHNGSDHRKFLRQIMVSVDITAPLYWWKEFDTYKVGTVANSCSTMHTIHKRELTLDDFSHEQLIDEAVKHLETTIEMLNQCREVFLNWDDIPIAKLDPQVQSKKHVWYHMIQLLPSSYNQKRTVTLNYEVLLNQYHARKAHKLDEWRVYCDWVKSLPYFEGICL